MSRSRRRRAPGPPSAVALAPTGSRSTPARSTRRAREIPTRSSAGGRWLLVVGILVVVAAGTAILVRGLGTGASPGSSLSPASTAQLGGGGGSASGLVTGAALPVYDAVGVDAAIGRTVPAIDGVDSAGRPLAIDPDDGRAKVILFLTHWCSHCQAEVPRVQAWLDGGATTGKVDLYAISTAADPGRPNYPPAAWLDREGWTVPTVVDDAASSIAQAFGLGAFPYWVLVDADGRVALRLAGELSIADLENLLAGLGR